MTRITVSSKYQVVIPKEIRGQAEVRKGNKLIALVKDGVISLVPERRLSALRGSMTGMSRSSGREKKDRA